MRMNIGVLCLLASCTTTADTDGADTDPAATACPDGLQPTTNAELIATRFRFDGVDYPVTFDANSNSATASPACIRDDGSELYVPIFLDMLRFGTLIVRASTDVSASLTDSTGSVRILLDGAPVAVDIEDGSEWQSGVFTVTHPEGGLAVEIDGLAIPDGHALSVRLSAEGRPAL